jgi:hypothetical protein
MELNPANAAEYFELDVAEMLKLPREVIHERPEYISQCISLDHQQQQAHSSAVRRIVGGLSLIQGPILRVRERLTSQWLS